MERYRSKLESEEVFSSILFLLMWAGAVLPLPLAAPFFLLCSAIPTPAGSGKNPLPVVVYAQHKMGLMD